MPLTAPFALPSLSSNLIPDLRSAVSHALALLSLAPIAFLLYRLFIAPVLFTIYSPLRIVPRIEKRDSRWTGNVAAVYTDEPAVAQMKWLAEKKSSECRSVNPHRAI